jgi:hypothetical protein
VFPARYELNSYIVFRKRLVSKRLRTNFVKLPSIVGSVNFKSLIWKSSIVILRRREECIQDCGGK